MNKRDKEIDPVLCGFVFCHGKKDYSVCQMELAQEIQRKIEDILEDYINDGCSVRNAYEYTIKEMFPIEM